MESTLRDVTRQAGGRDLRRVVFSSERIAKRVQELGREITHHYPDDGSLLVLGLLKGSFIFLADLVRAIHLPLEVDFLVASSYGDGRASSGDVKLVYDPQTPIDGRHVLLVEDIIDSGHTLERLIPLLKGRDPASLQVCALLHKRLAKEDPEIRWVGFDAPAEFLVGYGLDDAEDLRHLPFIASI